MIFSDWLRTVLANLNRMRGRVALTAFGVVIGTTAVMVLVSLGAGLQRSATGSLGSIANLKQISVMAPEGMVVAGPGMVRSAGGEKSASASRRPPALTTQGLTDLAAVPGVSGVVALEDVRFDVLQYRQLQGYAQATGVTAGALETLGLTVESGSLAPGRGQVVVGARVQENFWDVQRGQPGEVESLLGQTLTLVASKYDASTGESSIRTWRYLVAGVLAESGESDYQMYMPQRDAQAVNEWVLGNRINRNKDGYERVIVVVEDSGDVLTVQTQIRDMGYSAYSAMDAVSQINSFFGVLQAVLGSIGAIALLVAALGIVNTLSMAILERTREIGLMKAVGARNRDVMLIFLGEAAIIGLLGGVLGAGLGWLISGAANLVIGGFMQQSGSEGGFFGGSPDAATASIVYTPFWLPIFAIAFATLIGLVSGVYPALRAATLDPLRALKYE